MLRKSKDIDICLILEGTYPYMVGGVSTWVHEMIQSMPEKNFALMCIQPQDAEDVMRYSLPENVVEISTLHLQKLKPGRPLASKAAKTLFKEMLPHLLNIQKGQGALADLEAIIRMMDRHKGLGYLTLLNSREVWEMLEEMYEAELPDGAFLDYFWSWRALLGGVFSVVQAKLPKAKTYHCLSTGFAGVLAGCARVRTDKPVILTEHGLYTNERRIELNSSDWIHDYLPVNLNVESNEQDLRALWMQSFQSYASICYEAASKIVTLYEGNQQAQQAAGAPINKLTVIPNGVDYDRFASITRAANDDTRPTIALIGRVVPIKDVKSFIRTAMLVQESVPGLQALIIGPHDEDPAYYQECRQMVENLMLQDVVEFTGRLSIEDALSRIDVNVLTSISEVQPLVLLESGAAGIPTVATDIGACREMIEGRPEEGESVTGGAVVALANPADTAQAVIALLNDPERRKQAGETMRRRVADYYRKDQQISAYEALYDRWKG
jgi:glycosyltransferase involved in cell wall biosynthesis